MVMVSLPQRSSSTLVIMKVETEVQGSSPIPVQQQTTAAAAMEDQQSGQVTDGSGDDGRGDGGGLVTTTEGEAGSSPATTASSTVEVTRAPLQAPAPMEPQHHCSDAETDDDDSLAAFVESAMLLKKYSATRRTGIQQHKRNSVIEAEMEEKDDSAIDSEGIRSAGAGNRSSSVVVGRGDRITPAAATAIPLRFPAGASQPSQPSQRPAPPPQRRSIFPHLHNAAGGSAASQHRKQQKASNGSTGSSRPAQQQPSTRYVQQHHRRSHSFEQEEQSQTQPSQATALLSPLKISFPSKNLSAAAWDSSPSSVGGESSASKASRPRLPSNEDLINAMDDKYDPSKNARQQQAQQNRLVQQRQSPQRSPIAPTGNASSATTRSGFVATYTIPPFRSNRESKHLRPATATEMAAGGDVLAKEAASGEIVCSLPTKYSPRRKASLFEGSTLPKVQHTPKAQPEALLTPRSPPRARDATKPLPSILRKTSGSFHSPIFLSPPGAAGGSGQKTMPRTVVSFGSGTGGGGAGSSALDELSNGSASSRSNVRRPEVSRSNSAKITRSELEHHPQQTSGMTRSASKDESSVGSSSTIRSSSSLRRVNSENSVASSVETERKRITAITLASVASAASEKEIRAEDSDGNKTFKKKSLTRHGSLDMCTAMNKEISFDARVWVVEYEQDEGNKWFTHEELDSFKCEAIERIRRRHAQQHLLPSGTGRVVPMQMVRRTGSGRALFTDPALGCNEEENDDDDEDETPTDTRNRTQTASAAAAIPSHVPFGMSPSDERRMQRALLSEIRNILVVDPHDMFLKLFAKALRAMMNHVIVTTATSAEEALRRIAAAKVVFPQSENGATHGFDIIIVEERLQLFHRHQRGTGSNRKQQQTAGDEQKQRQIPASGSALIGQIAAEQQRALESAGHTKRPRCSLLVGVSAHIQLDGDKLSRAGADLVWGKPPPPFDDELRIKILRAVLSKRAKPIYF